MGLIIISNKQIGENMKNWKKAGLTALAGSLVAVSASAGELGVTGGATLTYTANSGAEDSAGTSGDGVATKNDGSRWGQAAGLTFSGSGEMDNGWTVTYSQSLTNAASSARGITLDMGDMGSLNYESSTGARGIGKIDDVMPTAHEEVFDGLDANGTTSGGGVSGLVGGGTKGFNWSNTIDIITVNLGYAPKSAAGSGAGGISGPGGGASAYSGTVELSPLDGLNIGAGWGETNSAVSGQTNDNSTWYAKYTWGPVTAGYQISNVDTYGTTADDESTSWGILYAVNDDMSISYGERENDDSSNTLDEETSGFSVSYTMGSMSFTLHSNEGKNMGNAASMVSEHTEASVTFSF